jgi:hypothetical protein
LTCLHHAFLLAYLREYRLLPLHRPILWVDHWPIALTYWPTVRVESLLPSMNLVDRPSLPSIDWLHSVFHRSLLLIPFDLFFPKNGVNSSKQPTVCNRPIDLPPILLPNTMLQSVDDNPFRVLVKLEKLKGEKLTKFV